jgi:hypothetical protein
MASQVLPLQSAFWLIILCDCSFGLITLQEILGFILLYTKNKTAVGLISYYSAVFNFRLLRYSLNSLKVIP